MVQHSFSVSTWKKLSHQSINFKEASYSASTFLFTSTKKRCIDSTTQKDRENNSMCNEPSSKIFIWLSNMALESQTEDKRVSRNDECFDGLEEDMQPSWPFPTKNRIKSSQLGSSYSSHCSSHVLEIALLNI